MLRKMVREYVAIVSHLTQLPEPLIKDGALLVSREKLVSMLDRYPYLPATKKLTVWRNLGWLNADMDHFTRQIREENGKRVRRVFLNLTAYKQLSELLEMTLD